MEKEVMLSRELRKRQIDAQANVRKAYRSGDESGFRYWKQVDLALKVTIDSISGYKGDNLGEDASHAGCGHTTATEQVIHPQGTEEGIH